MLSLLIQLLYHMSSKECTFIVLEYWIVLLGLHICSIHVTLVRILVEVMCKEGYKRVGGESANEKCNGELRSVLYLVNIGEILHWRSIFRL